MSFPPCNYHTHAASRWVTAPSATSAHANNKIKRPQSITHIEQHPPIRKLTNTKQLDGSHNIFLHPNHHPVLRYSGKHKAHNRFQVLHRIGEHKESVTTKTKDRTYLTKYTTLPNNDQTL
ncbi:hypothetical protein, unlikely [Trypanosoma brucei gambiense DAL972]|uniref:Uncharacterized protein n=1 Tax=Trypanosoma brucei gambiense (strain MHOM/CI/86/DAL972) TaxID=679716 RepID=C9ZJ34_TRYB9|nr:hypothetical protein, unlikely [Trypanosoma brucei gambiense DAL972]CBH09392.1 hypothetical protein, unlikely [Trypanosoma brucei gambiense DAL972]|eukprot:XP_011771698.1 hypothetical protein, unlikely [Trypanosoma brucei gambiense DAL972]